MSGFIRRSHRIVYENPWLRFEAHAIDHPNGRGGEHGLVVIPPAVGIVLVDDGGTSYVTRQERFAARRSVLEIVKGGADAHETPLQAAQRETREELGLAAAAWTTLGIVYEIPSIVDGPVTLFLARELHEVESAPESVESIERVALPFHDLVTMALAGEIVDAVSAAAIVRAAHVMNGLWAQGKPAGA